MEWFCRTCWRHGDFVVDMPEKEALSHGAFAHKWQVDADMRAVKVPGGMRSYANSTLMLKFPAVDCEGDIRIGESVKKRTRFDKQSGSSFNFGETK